MRIITGSARGTKLKSLPGIETRPTAEKVKEAVFSIIQFDIEGRHVLDLFAGTGQLGLEALSRGAADAVFTDNSKQAAALITENAEKCKLSQLSDIRNADYRSVIQSLPKKKFGIVFIDPPYLSGQLQRALETISSVDIMSENGIIICESDKTDKLPDGLRGLVKGKEYLYGGTKITLYTASGEKDE